MFITIGRVKQVTRIDESRFLVQLNCGDGLLVSGPAPEAGLLVKIFGQRDQVAQWEVVT